MQDIMEEMDPYGQELPHPEVPQFNEEEYDDEEEEQDTMPVDNNAALTFEGFE